MPRKEKDPRSFTLPCFINDFYFDNALVDLGASVSIMPLSTYLNLGLGELAYTRLTVELADRTVKYPKGIAKNVLVGIGKYTFPIDFVILDMPEDVKVPLILGRPFLSTAYAKIDVYKKKDYFEERMELDLETRLMGETLVLNRSLDPFSEDYIELYDLNEPIKLRRNQGDDLIPTIEEGEVIEEFRTRNEDLDTRIEDYPSYYFAVLENMDAYRDEGMGDVIFVIMEYLVKVSKRRAFWSLNEDILKITILKTNTPYPSRKIRRIRACTHQRPQRKEEQYAVSRRSQYAVLKIEASGLRPYHFTYPERKLMTEEMLYKFIDEVKREHEEMRAFICDFQTTNEILFKERNNLLIELRFGVQELLKVINNTPMINCELKGLTTRGGKTTTQDAQNNDTNVRTEEPMAGNHDKPAE
ncbi:hypothetical protein Tco_1393692 [Tanacetum coccineum]